MSSGTLIVNQHFRSRPMAGHVSAMAEATRLTQSRRAPPSIPYRRVRDSTQWSPLRTSCAPDASRNAAHEEGAPAPSARNASGRDADEDGRRAQYPRFGHRILEVRIG